MKCRTDFPISFCHLINDGFGCSDRDAYSDVALQDQFCCECLNEVLSEIMDYFRLCDEKYKEKN